ncbi:MULTISPECIES: OsmC family protein [Sphingobium]|uniref:Osmotically inducible protein OsmC n=1 Tax=Sphingobium ummariense RL-3 TaxID=1346791 RepID=T0IVT5_9SPHN|nr:OsmC family protein [Sphingobium ummariense]EQB29896.1 hypothetical protein M529_22485 [Sphingobium ummariense RL-3]
MSKLTTTAIASETGGLPFAVRISVEGHIFAGDEPIEAGGTGLGPSPYQLLTSALAECTAMTVRWFARQHDVPLDHVSVEVVHSREQVEGRAGLVDTFNKTIKIKGDALTEDQLQRLHDVASKCPVQRTLEAGSIIVTRPG